MSPSARLRLLFARRGWLYWALVGALAATAGYLVLRAAAGVEAARESWGETAPVVVALADIEPGAPLGAAVEMRDVPRPMLPAGALDTVPAGAVARQRIANGEVVVTHDVAAAAAPQSLIPTGWLAVAVAEPVPSGVGVGDVVRVASGGVVLSDDGVVVGIAGEAVLVAVPADAAAQVAHAASSGDVALLLVG
jgi:hypothetical protein